MSFSSQRDRVLFLSYARADVSDEDFIPRLHQKLGEAGYPTWWDRVDMPSRGLAFMQEIRRAIDGARRLLVVLGPHAAGSEYVRAEWQHALATSKIVIPLLRVGGTDTLPPELRPLHFVDVRPERPFNEAWAELLRQVSAPDPALGELFGRIPEVPPHHRPRPDLTRALADGLLGNLDRPLTRDGRGQVFVVHGMGGSGKSVLASTFARSTSARRAFDCGVYWLDVRDEADPLRFGRTLSELLSGARAGDLDLTSTTHHLRQALAGKRALVVIDNLTFAKAITPLLHAMDANTRVLVTTRQAAILAGTARLVVEDFGLEEALQFLTDWASDDANIERSSLEELVSVSGRHPLALALNGAMLEKGHDLDDLVAMLTGADLQFAEDPSFDYAYSTVFKALDVSMRVLEREAPGTAEFFRSFSLFFWNDSVTETTLERFWVHRTGVAAPSVRRSLAELDGAFIRRESTTGTRLVRLHDLWLKYLVLTGTVNPALHESLVKAWTLDCDGDWSRGPDDEYFLRHLVSHLIASGRRTEALELLTGSAAWMDRLDRFFTSDEPFFEQVARVFRDTDAPDELARLHAARLVVGLRTGQFENADLAALAYADRVKQARAWARLREEPSERLASLLVVASALAETGVASEGIVREAARELDRIRDPRERGRAWVGLAKTWAALGRFDEVQRIEQTHEEDPATGDSIWYGLSEIASAAGNFPRAFEIARRIRAPWSRWQALRALARRHAVPEADRRALLDAMAIAAQTVDASEDPGRGLIAQNVYWLSAWGHRDEAVRQARQLPAIGRRVQALSFAFGALLRARDPRASELRDEIMGAIGTLERQTEEFLEAVSSSVSASLLVGSLDLAEQVARLVGDPEKRSDLLTRVALAAVQDGIFDVSGRVAAELESPWSDVVRARSVEAHLARGQPEDADRALAVVHSPECRAYALRVRLKARLEPAARDLELDTLVAEAADCARNAVARGPIAWRERSLLVDSPRRWQSPASERPPDEELALLLASRGRAEDARRLADGIEGRRRLALLREMAVLLFRAGDERARPWLHQVVHDYRRLSAPAGSKQNIRTTLVELLSRDRQTALARRLAADDPWLLAHIARERAGDGELTVAWDLATDIPHGHARAAVLAELAARTHADDPVLARERFGKAIDAVYETTERMSRDAAFYAVAEQAARCGCLSQLTKLVEDPRRTQAVSQGSTVSMSNMLAIARAPRRLTTALVTRSAESGDRVLAFEQAQSVEDAATRCAVWTAIGATIGRTDAAAAGEAFDEAEMALQKVEESSDRSDLAARLCEDLIHAGFLERGARFLKQATAAQRRAMLAPAIAAFVRSEGLEAAASLLHDLDEQTDEARGALFEAARDVRAIDDSSLLELARSIRAPAARAIALAKAASRAATARSPIAGQALDHARSAVDALDEASDRRTPVVELAGAFAAAGRYREAFGTLPRQSPNELIHTLAGWPDALRLVRHALPVLTWVQPDWEEFALALRAAD